MGTQHPTDGRRARPHCDEDAGKTEGEEEGSQHDGTACLGIAFEAGLEFLDAYTGHIAQVGWNQRQDAWREEG